MEQTSVLGAHSWLEALFWLAAIATAIVAVIQLRHQALQGRATLFLSLYQKWEALSPERRTFYDFYKRVGQRVLKKNFGTKDRENADKLRVAFTAELEKLKSNDPMMTDFVAYLNFFETIGTYVRKRYIPMREVRALYKGAVLEIDTVFRGAIGSWERQSQVAEGLFGNATALMRQMRYREDHPIKYWVVYPYRRLCGW